MFERGWERARATVVAAQEMGRVRWSAGSFAVARRSARSRSAQRRGVRARKGKDPRGQTAVRSRLWL